MVAGEDHVVQGEAQVIGEMARGPDRGDALARGDLDLGAVRVADPAQPLRREREGLLPFDLLEAPGRAPQRAAQPVGTLLERAQRYLDDPTLVRNIVADGCERARKLAEETMRDVREAMGLDYT